MWGIPKECRGEGCRGEGEGGGKSTSPPGLSSRWPRPGISSSNVQGTF